MRLRDATLATCGWGTAKDDRSVDGMPLALAAITEIARIAKVIWPSRREVMLTTIMVFIMAALAATFFSLVDMAIRFGLRLVIGG